MQQVATKELATLSRRFDVFSSQGPPPRSLVASGLVPPIPLWHGEPLWGFPIIVEAASAGVEELSTRSVDCDADEAICIALELEGRCGRYGFGEKAGLLSLITLLEIDTPSSRLESLVQPSGSFIEPTKRFLSLPETTRDLINDGRIDLRTAARLGRLHDEVWRAIASRADLSVSETRILATDLDEVCRRDELDEAACLDLAKRVLTADRPVEVCRSLRFPMLTEMRNRFESVRRDILEGSGVDLQPPENFEGSSFAISFVFSSCGEIDRKLEAIERLRVVCDELFDLL